MECWILTTADYATLSIGLSLWRICRLDEHIRQSISRIGDVAQWLGRRSLAGRFSLIQRCLVHILVLRANLKSLSLYVQSLSLKAWSLSFWPSPWKVLVLPLFSQRVKTSPVSTENSFNHLKCLQRCFELNGFTSKSAIVPIRPRTYNIGLESVICWSPM